MKPLASLAGLAGLLVIGWLVWRLLPASTPTVVSSVTSSSQVGSPNPPMASLGATIPLLERPTIPSPNPVPPPKPGITAEQLQVKINMLRTDLSRAKNDGHRMFILRRIADNCTKAGSFVQCGQVLEGVSDLVTDPPLSEELKGMIEALKKRAKEAEEKSGFRGRPTHLGWGVTTLAA